LENPNKNGETFQHVLRAVIKDILEVDAGVIVKVFTVNSYDFDHLEPKSGAPLLKPFGQRKMVEIYARDGASFLKETDKFGFVRGHWQYSYQIPAHPMWFNRDEICYIMENPRSMSTYGFARTQAILDLVKSLHYSTLYNKKFFEEYPLPEGVLSLLDTNETEMKTFMDWWNREFKAQPHKLGVLNKDIKWQTLTIPNRELEFLETQQQYFRFVIAMFGLTPAELGMTEDLNRATSATQAELTKRKGIRPILNLLEKYINADIIPEFGFEGIQFTFIYDDPAEKAAKLANYKTELEMGIRTPNEVREELGEEPLPLGDMTNEQRMFTQVPQKTEGQEMEEKPEAQSGNYTAQRKREEGIQVSNRVLNPYSLATRPVGSFRSFEPKLTKELSPRDMDSSIAEASRIYGIPEGVVKEGFSHELEHAESVGNDYYIILEIALDHLKEDIDYYIKLKQLEKPITQLSERYGVNYSGMKPTQKAISEEDIRQIKREIYLDLSNEIYRILVASGMSERRAAEYAQKLRMRARTKGVANYRGYKIITHTSFDPNVWIARVDEEDIKVEGHNEEDVLNQAKRKLDRISKRINKELENLGRGKWKDKYGVFWMCEACGKIFRSEKGYINHIYNVRCKDTKKGIYDGQYYNVPNEVILPSKGTIIQPQANQMLDPLVYGDTMPSQLASDFREQNASDYQSRNQYMDDTGIAEGIKCPNCGFNTLYNMTSADDMGQEIRYRCTNCLTILTQEEIDNKVLEGLTETMQRNPSTKPITIPFWSPKSLNNFVKDWTGIDIKKQGIETHISDYINSKEYIKMISKYLRDLSAIKRNKLRAILERGIKENLSIREIRKQIEKELGIDKNRAEMITRTETARIENISKINKLKEDKIKKGVWLTARDERTCKICKPRHMKEYSLKKLKEMFKEIHPNCRCSFSEI